MAHLNNSLPPIHFSTWSYCLQEPDFQIDDALLNSRNHDQLTNTENSLTTALNPQDPSHRVLASRALVRACLGLWDEAIADANEVPSALLSHTLMLIVIFTKSIEIQPSVMACIAKSVAHVRKGERDEGYRACDIAFEHSHSTHVSFLLLIKACILYIMSWSSISSSCFSGCRRVYGRGA